MEANNIVIDNSLLIEYAHGLLVPEIAAKVKQALAEDETLRWEYDGIIQLMNDFPDKDPDEVLNKMVENLQIRTASPQVLQQTKRSKVVTLWKPLTVAASVIVVAAVLLLLNFSNKRQDPVKLAEQIVSEARFTDDTRGDSILSSATWQEYFKKQSYDSAINLLTAKSSLNHQEQFYLGLSYLKVSPPQPGKATLFLKEATTSGIEYQSDAWLYLGISQILENKNNEAIKSLENIKQHPQATELLERLRK